MATRTPAATGAKEVPRTLTIRVDAVPARTAEERGDSTPTRAKAPISTTAAVKNRDEKRAAIIAAIAPTYSLFCESHDGEIWLAEAVDGDYEFPVQVRLA